MFLNNVKEKQCYNNVKYNTYLLSCFVKKQPKANKLKNKQINKEKKNKKMKD